jgi:N,N-dimethylformamidase
VLAFPTLVDAPATIARFDGDDTSAWIEVDPSELRAVVQRAGQQPATARVPAPRPHSWNEISVTVDLAGGHLELHCRPLPTEGFVTRPEVAATADWPASPEARFDGATLTLAGRFNGKLERPRLCAGDDELVAEWDFSLGIPTEEITDVGPSGFHGVLRNLPARGTRGHRWTGESLSWVADPAAYAAIHFHDDDLGDAGWEPAFTLDVPEDLASGCYAVRVEPADRSTPEFWVPFVVRPAVGAPTRPVAFVVPTTTYGAYANMHLRVTAQFNELAHARLTVLDSTDFLLLDRPELGKSTYDVHRDGSPVLYSSMARPVTNYRPTGRMYSSAST